MSLTWRLRGAWPAVAGAAALLALAHGSALGGPPAWWALAYNLGLLAALFAVAGALGHAILEWLDPSALLWPGWLVVAATLGCGVMSLGLLALGLLGLYYPPLLAALFCGLAAAVAPHALTLGRALWRRPRRRVARRATVVDWLIVTCGVLIVATFAVTASRIPLPPHDFDALAYHQVGVKLYLAAHAMIPLAQYGSADGPINTELLFLLGAAFGSDSFGQAVVWGQGALTTALVVCLGWRYWGRLAGWLGGCLYVSISMVAVFLAVPYNDGGLALGELTVLASLIAQSRRPTWRGATVCGLLLGLTLGQKMSALPFTAAIALAGLILWLRSPLWPTLGRLGLVGAVGLLVALPWYVRNALWFANPFMPFGVSSVSVANLDATSVASAGPPVAAHPLLTVLAPLAGVGWLFWNYVSPLLLLAPLATLLSPRRVGVTCVAVALVGYAYWARYTPWNLPPRYLLCWLAPLALAAGAALAWPGQRANWAPLAGLTAAPVLALALLNVLVQYTYAINHDGVGPYLAGRQGRNAYLSGAVSSYQAMRALNALNVAAPVALIGEARSYYLVAPAIPDWGASVLGVWRAAGPPRLALAALWREGARYALVADSQLPPQGGDAWAAGLRQGMVALRSGLNGYTIYRLRPPMGPTR